MLSKQKLFKLSQICNIEKLDQDIIPLIYKLNFELNIKTKFSCSGHYKYDKAYIMFDSNVSIKQINILINKISKIKNNDFNFTIKKFERFDLDNNYLCNFELTLNPQFKITRKKMLKILENL